MVDRKCEPTSAIRSVGISQPASQLTKFMRKYGNETSRILGSREYIRDGWQVSLIGVRPDMQGIGIGRVLMRFMVQKVRSRDSAF